MNPESAKITLKTGCDILEKLGIKYWLSAGTLLGAYRDKGFIENDTDIDIEVLGDDSVEDILKSVPATWDLLARKRINQRHFQLAFIDRKNEDTIFDIYFFYECEGGELENINEHGRLWYPAIKFNNLSEIELYGDLYPCPEPEWYCRHRFGATWNIPQKKDLWEEQAANIQHVEYNKYLVEPIQTEPLVKACVFTICKNEEMFLPIWLEYYQQNFSNKDIYILDHESNDGSTSDLPCNVEIIRNEFAFEHGWLLDQVKRKQEELLKEYEVVIFAEADELIIPLDCTLRQYINMFEGEVVRCRGYHLIQMEDENEYDPQIKILDQRKYWSYPGTFDKPLISRKPLDWVQGFHHAQDASHPTDDTLILLHLHYFDYEYTLRKHIIKESWNWKDEGEAGYQNHAPTEWINKHYENLRKMAGPIIERLRKVI